MEMSLYSTKRIYSLFGDFENVFKLILLFYFVKLCNFFGSNVMCFFMFAMFFK